MPRQKANETFFSEVMIASPIIELLEDYTPTNLLKGHIKAAFG